ncbi:GntR family transcriptional regulator [Caballeronia pedi]|uniref:GntR family transcriptional regulator n=1 Tax=Caballeronia pedi TaxID=1777141 RepID=A0A158CDP4_9BURK|nr:GntR family transcriptional regulator [Caballeronia pedi]SAK80410.1 GntR family transcriptional regulator [Caballeronia pedi]
MTQPRFKQIEEALRQRIVSNDLAPGVKLPSEAELVAQHGVSRITIRQALAGLHASGLIEKINGKGSFVTRPAERSDLGQLTGFYEAARKRGQTAHGELLSVRQVAAPPFALRTLGLEEGDTLVCATTLRLWDAVPVALFMVMGDAALIEALVAEDLETNDVMSIFEERLGYRLKHVDTESAAIAATKDHARRLKVEPGTPLLRVRCTPFDIQGNALCCAELLFRGDRFAYRAKVSR